MGAAIDRGSLLHKRYRIVEILGQGGMGSVYRAVDENLGVDVAVKENLFTTDEYARQFRLEAVILANLRHPNLPRVTDHFVVGDQGQYLIMDFIEGEDLRQRMERIGIISEEEAILIGAAMCDALHYLHTRKPSVIHRDVKPGNVRITPDGHIYLVDFGLAKLVRGSQATTTGARAMTPGYSPPEQYGTARTDARTDIYSLGATLYAALTGVIPEDGLARAMDNVEMTPLRKHNPKVSRKLAAAIERAMAVRPDDRYQTAEEFKQALAGSNVRTQILEDSAPGEPLPQEGAPDDPPAWEVPAAANSQPVLRAPSKPGGKGVRAAGFWLPVSMLAVLVVVSLLVFWAPLSRAFPVLPVASRMTATPSVTPGPSQTPTLTLTPSITPTPTETLTPTPTALGGGYGQIAFASNRTGAPQIFIMNEDGSRPRQVTNLPVGACQPDWSPDGERIVFISPCMERSEQYPGAKMYIVNVDGSGLIELDSSEEGDFDPAWSPDGSRIAFTSLRDGSPQIYVLSLADTEVTRLTEVSSDVRLPDQSRQPAWSPTGTQLAYTGRSRITGGSLQIWVMSDVGVNPILLVRSGPVTWDSHPAWSPDGDFILYSQSRGGSVLGWLMLLKYEDYLDDIGGVIRNYAINGAFSPDGNWILYESPDVQNPNRSDYDIYRIDSDGQQFSRLTNHPAMDFDPVWRPSLTP